MVHHKWGVGIALAFSVIACANVVAQKKAQPATAKTQQPTRAAIDKPIKDFRLKDLTRELKDGEKESARLIALSQYKDKKPVVLFFMSDKCGTTWRYEKRVGTIMAKYGEKDVAFLAVRCSALDTEADIIKFADARNFNMPILDDKRGELTRYFKVETTPTFVLIDSKGVFRYFGSFDDNPEEKDAVKTYLPNAVSAVLDKKVVAVKQTPPFG